MRPAKQPKTPSTDFLGNTVVRRYVLSGKIIMDASKEEHIMKFRRILEYSMAQGRWNGFFAMES